MPFFFCFCFFWASNHTKPFQMVIIANEKKLKNITPKNSQWYGKHPMLLMNTFATIETPAVLQVTLKFFLCRFIVMANTFIIKCYIFSYQIFYCVNVCVINWKIIELTTSVRICITKCYSFFLQHMRLNRYLPKVFFVSIKQHVLRDYSFSKSFFFKLRYLLNNNSRLTMSY